MALKLSIFLKRLRGVTIMAPTPTIIHSLKLADGGIPITLAMIGGAVK